MYALEVICMPSFLAVVHIVECCIFFFVTMVNTQICLIFTWQDDDHHLFCPAVLDRSLFSSFLPLNSTSSL
uniref:Putative secreted protein n=1 Tax=Ixodes ricinus TaxID=34613 RepID=A0A6B0U2E3_IXORI